MRRFFHVCRVFGIVLMVFTCAFAAPVLTALVFEDGEALRFASAAAANFAVGVMLWRIGRSVAYEPKARDGFLILGPLAVLLAASAALPLMFALPQLGFTDAYFEAMSGLTTSGATVLTQLDRLPPSINLWRHELSWIGGLAVLAMTTTILPLLGIGGVQVYRSDSVVPVRDNGLTPRFRRDVRGIWGVYAALTVACALALKAAGMSTFDALCHALSALSLGGFSTHDANIAYFHSPLIETVLMGFMLLAGINFATHALAWRDFSLRAYRRDAEAKAYVPLLLVSCLLVAVYLEWHRVYGDFGTTLRLAAFQVISLATDCGFVATDYDRWPLAAPLWMLLLSCFAASSGSTGGGIRMIRTLILFRQSGRQISGLVHPRAIRSIKIGGYAIPDEAVYAVLGFVHLYALSIVGLTFLLVASGVDFLSAFSAIIAAINNNAHGLRAVGAAATFQDFSDFQTWVCTAAMLLGRLEIFLLVVPLTRAYWRE